MARIPIQLEITIPTPDKIRGNGFLHACTQALCREIRESAQELSTYDIRTLYLDGAGYLADEDLNQLLRALHHDLSLSGTEQTAVVPPERMSTARITTLRNFHVDLYEMDFGSLNYVDFQRLRRPYSYQQYDWLAQLFHYFDTTCVRAVLSCGLRAQTASSLTDSLKRTVSMGVDYVSVVPVPGSVLTEKEAAGQIALARELLTQEGYEQHSIFSYARHGCPDRRTVLQCTDAAYWGMGPGAVSFLDRNLAWNEADPDQYIRILTRKSEEEDSAGLITRTAGLDSLSLLRYWELRALHSAQGLDLSAFQEHFAQVSSETIRKAVAGLRALTESGYAALADGEPWPAKGLPKKGILRLTDLGIACESKAFPLLETEKTSPDEVT